MNYIDEHWNDLNIITSVYEENYSSKSGIIYFANGKKPNFITYVYTANAELEAGPVVFEIE